MCTIYEMQTIETRVCLLSQRYTSKQTGIPEHVGHKIGTTPSPDFPKHLEEMAVDEHAPATQQETKAPQVS